MQQQRQDDKDDSSIQNEIEVEIQGLSLLEERDESMNKVQEANRVMYFHALQLIRKQKHWLERLESESTELSRRKKALEELESKIEKASFEGSKSLPPQKALFKATALLDDSIEGLLSGKQHQGPLKVQEETEVVSDPERLPTSATLLEFYPDNDSCSEVYCDNESLGEKDMKLDDKDSDGDEEEENRDSPVTDYDEWMHSIDERAKGTSDENTISELIASRSISQNNPFDAVSSKHMDTLMEKESSDEDQDDDTIFELVATQSIAENNPFKEVSSESTDKIMEQDSTNTTGFSAPKRASPEKMLETILSTDDVLFEDPFSSNPFEDLEEHLKTAPAVQGDASSKTETDETDEVGTSRIEI